MRSNLKTLDSDKLRNRAEKRLEKKTVAVHLPGTAAEQQRLLHELQVHQIELEMQNAELRQARSELETVLEKYRDLYDSAPIGYLTLDRFGNISAVNLRGASYLGVDNNRLIGQRFDLFVKEKSRHDFTAFLDTVFTSRVKEVCEVALLREECSLIVQIEAMAAASGHECRLVLVDITCLRQTEVVIEDLTETICRFKADGTLTFVNDVYCRVFGETKGDLLGSKWHPVALPVDVTIIEEQLLKLSPSNPVMTIENRVYSGSGEVRWMQFINRGVFDKDGLHIETQSVGRDITEQKRAEEDRLVLEQHLQQTQRLESLGVLAGGIAHDFNNILSVILGHCTIIEEDIDSGMDQKTHVKLIEKAANRAADLCMQMLTYAGNNPQEIKRIDMWLLVKETATMLKSVIKKNIAIRLDLGNEVLEICADSAHIQQLIVYLSINAAEAIGDKKGKIYLKLRKIALQEPANTDFLGNAIQAGNYACLTVTDNGCGMDLETRKRIFEPFFTTKVKGRGLGLSAVLGIIKSHAGSLQFSSNAGAGTAFSVYFPLLDVTGVVKAAPTTSDISSRKGNSTILLVEDEEQLRTIFSAMLKAMGYSVEVASNGHEALEIYGLRRSEINLILLDIIMPEMGGQETYRYLREASPEVPIVLCSGYSVEDYTDIVENDCYAAVVQKPFRPDQLREAMKKATESGHKGH